MRTYAPSRKILRHLRSTPTLAIAGLLALSGCATFTENSTAATINGRDISRDKLETFIDEFAASDQFPLEDGVLATDDARNLLAGIIKADAYNSFLDEYGAPLTDKQRDDVRQQIGDETLGKFSNDLRNLIVDINAATKAISELKAPDESKIETLYNESPSLTGAMCARHVVVKKKDTAQKVLSLLADGADFADVAKKYSTEPAAKETGGALQGQTPDGKASPCMSILEYQQSFDPAFTRGALAARAGVPYGPVKSSFGWHVILLAPWDEVKDAALTIVNAEPGPNLATGWLANADISVDPAYGRWEPATGTIAAS